MAEQPKSEQQQQPLTAMLHKSNGKPATTQPPRTVLSMLDAFRARESDDYGQLMLAFREFIGQRRHDLDELEHWVGTK